MTLITNVKVPVYEAGDTDWIPQLSQHYDVMNYQGFTSEVKILLSIWTKRLFCYKFFKTDLAYSRISQFIFAFCVLN